MVEELGGGGGRGRIGGGCLEKEQGSRDFFIPFFRIFRYRKVKKVEGNLYNTLQVIWLFHCKWEQKDDLKRKVSCLSAHGLKVGL